METIIAVTIIALGMTGAGVIVRTSMFGNELTQDRMAALNFAREGIEAVRGIRDTNWLRYNGSCWNSIEGTSESDCGDSLIAEGSYYALKLDMSTLEYSLEDLGIGDDVFASEYQMYECSIESPDGATGAIYGNPVADCGGVETDFYREIYFVYDGVDSVLATVKVGWITDGEGKTVELFEKINNY